jgi:hypothetical protein
MLPSNFRNNCEGISTLARGEIQMKIEYWFITLFILLAVGAIFLQGWIFNWDWRCVLTDRCIIVK